jgi:hypothetical protein
MAHFVFFTGYTDPIPDGHVPDSVEYTLLWKQVYAAINGDGGGTWSPSAFITVGGSGFQLTGTGHSLAASARLNVESTGEVRLKNGALLLVDGSGSDIRIEVASNIPKITVGSTGVISLSGALDVEANGLVTVKNLGGVAVASGGEVLFQSGSLLQQDSGGVADIYGTVNLKNTGQLKAKSGSSTLFESGSQVTGNAGSTIAWSGALNVLGDLTLVGSSNWVNLSSARTVTRGEFDLIPLTYSTSGLLRSAQIAWFEALSTDGPAAVTDLATTTGGKSILRLLDLPVGAAITQVEIESQGFGGSGGTSTLPTYQLVSWAATGSTGLTTHTSAVDDDHSAGNWLSTTVTTTVTPGSPPTVTAGRNYGIKVTHPYDPSPSLGTQVVISRCEATLSATKLQL